MPRKIPINAVTPGTDTENAFRQLFSENYRRLFMEAVYLLQDEQEAKDLLQEIFIQLWNRQLTDTIESPGAYLAQAVRNRCFNLIKARKVKIKRDTEYQYSLPSATTIQQNEADKEDTGWKEQKTLGLRAAMQELSPKTARIFELYYVEKKSRHEVALEAGVSINTVKTVLSRGLNFLRNKLK